MEAPGGGPRPAAPEGPEGPAGMEEPGPAGPEEPGGAEESRSEEPGPEVPGEPAGAEELGPEEPRPAGLEVPRPEEPGPAGPAGAEEPVPEEPAGPEEPGPAGAGEEKEEAAAAAAAGEAPPAEGAARARGGAGRSEPPAEAERRGSEGAALAGAARGSEGSDEDEGSEDEEEDEDPRARAALLEEQRGLASERERLRQASCRLQLRLGQLLRLRRGEEPRRAAAGGEQRYAERLRRLRERRRREAAGCERRVAARRRGCRERRARAEAAWAALQARERRAALRGPGRRLGGGAAAAAAAVERVQAAERAVSEAHVENIKLKHEIQKLEAVLKAQGEGMEGVHFIDFEQLKKENQKYSEKIDDLSEELLKLQKKISNTVHIFSQFREKLQFVEAENQGRKAELMDVEAILSQKRDILTKTKQIRDRLRINNLKLQQKCGLLGNDTLLRDFEEKVDTVKLLSQRLEILQHHHAGLILTCNGIKKKIKEATSFVPC